MRVRKYVVGAYPASPAHKNWEPEQERDFFDLLSNNPKIGSLELPWTGQLHPHDLNWLYRNFPLNLGAVVTTIPFVMGELAKDPMYGLASPFFESRTRAVADIKMVHTAIKAFHEKTNSKVVKMVEIHTAPREMGSSIELVNSLNEITSWDWQGIELALEHCDAFISGQIPEKGFLTLEDELAAIQKVSPSIGIVINWGRSAIELRSADRVVEHIKIARESKILRGLIFSGASSEEGLFGKPWVDAHHPFKKSANHKFGDPNSLLTDELAQKALHAAGDLPWVGVKMGWPSGIPGTVRERHEMIAEALAALDS